MVFFFFCNEQTKAKRGTYLVHADRRILEGKVCVMCGVGRGGEDGVYSDFHIPSIGIYLASVSINEVN